MIEEHCGNMTASSPCIESLGGISFEKFLIVKELGYKLGNVGEEGVTLHRDEIETLCEMMPTFDLFIQLFSV